MTIADLIARLFLDTGNFDRNLVHSSAEIKQFKEMTGNASQFVSGLGGSLVGTAAKFAGWAGAGLAAKSALDKFMASGAETSLWLKEASAQWTGLINGFFDSLNHGDVSGFLSNFSSVNNALKNATASALALNNALNVYGMVKARHEAKITGLNASYRIAKKNGDTSELAKIKQEREEENKKFEIATKAMQMRLISTASAQAAVHFTKAISNYNEKSKFSFARAGDKNAQIQKMLLDYLERPSILFSKEMMDFKKAIKPLYNNSTVMSYFGSKNSIQAWTPDVSYNVEKGWGASQRFKKKYGYSPELYLEYKNMSLAEKNSLIQPYTDVYMFQNTIMSDKLHQSRYMGGIARTKKTPKNVGTRIEAEINKLIEQYNVETDDAMKESIAGKINVMREKLRMLKDGINGVQVFSNAWFDKKIAKMRDEMDNSANPKDRKMLNDKINDMLGEKLLRNAHELLGTDIGLSRTNVIDKGMSYYRSKGFGDDIASGMVNSDVSEHGNYAYGTGVTAMDLMTHVNIPNIKVPNFFNTDSMEERAHKFSLFTGSMRDMASAMGDLSNIAGDSVGSWLKWSAGVLSSVGAALPAIAKIIPALAAKAGAEAMGANAAIGPFGWISGIAAMVSIIAAFASLPKFAVGGIVPGGSYTGDRVLTRLNSGEMVLNWQQQSRLFAAINNGSIARGLSSLTDGRVQFTVRGSDLVGVLHNNSSRRAAIV